MVRGKEERREMSEETLTFSFHVFTAVGTLSFLVFTPAETKFRFLKHQPFYATIPKTAVAAFKMEPFDFYIFGTTRDKYNLQLFPAHRGTGESFSQV